ncbi:MAG: site-specific integrase [Candidatus Woesearchaeota archaeon]|jgi:integrase|nr:site-specific integrase [Candidatus Woesearchaeota archaeon]MDP7647596.1 site-specific integrase [Candidatus Woesearchaeota archaeon]
MEDIAGFDKLYGKALKRLKTEKWKHPENKRLVQTYLKECQLGRVKSGNSYKHIQAITLYRSLGIIRLASEKWVNKEFDQAKPQDWNRFYERMETDKILNAQSNPYKQGARAKIYKTIRKFLKWRYGRGKELPEYCENWVVAEGIPTMDTVITKQQLDIVVKRAKTIHKNITAVVMLWDGGFRIKELCSLRWQDIKWLEDKNRFQVHVRAETTKTQKERHVSLNYSTDYLRALKHKALQQEGYRPDQRIFDQTIQSLARSIKLAFLSCLNIDISPHTLRHSSCTYYAEILKNDKKFCYRYWGVAFSKEANRYIHMKDDLSSIDEVNEYDNSSLKTELQKTKLELQELRTAYDRSEKWQKHFEEKLQARMIENIAVPIPKKKV